MVSRRYWEDIADNKDNVSFQMSLVNKRNSQIHLYLYINVSAWKRVQKEAQETTHSGHLWAMGGGLWGRIRKNSSFHILDFQILEFFSMQRWSSMYNIKIKLKIIFKIQHRNYTCFQYLTKLLSWVGRTGKSHVYFSPIYFRIICVSEKLPLLTLKDHLFLFHPLYFPTQLIHSSF